MLAKLRFQREVNRITTYSLKNPPARVPSLQVLPVAAIQTVTTVVHRYKTYMEAIYKAVDSLKEGGNV
jgi:hypothetical protein